MFGRLPSQGGRFGFCPPKTAGFYPRKNSLWTGQPRLDYRDA
jgi:hypothetical protein